MSTPDDEIHTMVQQSASHATDVLAYVTSLTDDPVLVLTSLMLSAAVFARSTGLDKAHFMEGSRAAFDSVEEGTPHAAH
jgi:hypothetical protein